MAMCLQPAEHSVPPVAMGGDGSSSKAGESWDVDTLRTFDGATQAMREFVNARDWDKFHSSKNLVVAMVGEVGEVAELFRWCSGVSEFSRDGREQLNDELADVLAFLLRLAEKCEVDLPSALSAKLAKNCEKYPISSAHGSCAKYDQHEQLPGN